MVEKKREQYVLKQYVNSNNGNSSNGNYKTLDHAFSHYGDCPQMVEQNNHTTELVDS